jgi:hypothetical protein
MWVWSAVVVVVLSSLMSAGRCSLAGRRDNAMPRHNGIFQGCCNGDTLDVVMEKTSLEEKTSLSTQVGAPGPAAWASPPPTGADTCSGPATGMDSTITTEPTQVMGLFTCLRGCRRASDGTDVTSLLTSRHAHSCRKCV